MGLVLTGRAVMRSVCWHSPIVSVSAVPVSCRPFALKRVKGAADVNGIGDWWGGYPR